ncbi:MAG TPA: GNAT family N-acetyltransferase [Stackebrandtia sp.]|uniref:GNAT family N-acetyltransferase n=1 Tax=Stackebrandtia sp. TaxID=2023065 RepID=UPI002D4394A4|nr:GNAT family N-acetyltransferase [Stackebrandtia sp.]HZE39230.1 GNAT family N-acetyltransferase [Stackebrandtia sp.]
MVVIRSSYFTELGASTLYALLKLRTDVFVVEQRAAYPELDGRDTEPGTRHVWAEEDGRVVAYLRVLVDDGGFRVGRVCTAASARGRGLAGRLLGEALKPLGAKPVCLDAQLDAIKLYERHGFAVTGPSFMDDDGIAHVPMRRSPNGQRAPVDQYR